MRRRLLVGLMLLCGSQAGAQSFPAPGPGEGARAAPHSLPASRPVLALPTLEEALRAGASSSSTSGPTDAGVARPAGPSPAVALALSGGASVASYGLVVLGAKVFVGGLTRGVAIGVGGLTGAVIGPSAGLLYAKDARARLWWPAGVRLLSSTALIYGVTLREQDPERALRPAAAVLLVGGGLGLVGAGLFDIVRAPLVAGRARR